MNYETLLQLLNDSNMSEHFFHSGDGTIRCSFLLHTIIRNGEKKDVVTFQIPLHTSSSIYLKEYLPIVIDEALNVTIQETALAVTLEFKGFTWLNNYRYQAMAGNSALSFPKIY